MLARLDRLISSRTVILAFPVVFLTHDGEEVLTTEGFLREHRMTFPLPAALKNQLEVTTAQFAVAVAYLFTLVSGTPI